MLECVERPDPVAAGVNFMDIGVRKGIAWTEVSNPKILGVEAVYWRWGFRRGHRTGPARRVGLCTRKLCSADRNPGRIARAGSRHDR
jgi:hypothetical protein